MAISYEIVPPPASALAYGTDAGVQPHGLNGGQLRIYVEVGMTPLQALQSATLVAARLLRREDRLGRLATGYVGDVVAVRGNPLEDIRTVESPVFVMKDGRVVKDVTGRIAHDLAAPGKRTASGP